MTSNLQPRECILTKEEGKSFGFFLRIEKGKVGHLIRSVEKNGPACKSGLKDGDRLLRVDGLFVDEKEHAEVVELIKTSGNSVSLLVLDEASYENEKKREKNLSELKPNQSTGQSMMNGVTSSNLQPRLCYLMKEKNTYGFSLKTTQGIKGIFLSNLVPNGAAVKAGVHENDRIIEVNGVNVENDTHEQVGNKVKNSGDHVLFLLTDKETEEYYHKKKLKLNAENATLELLPLKPRTVELKKGSDGYGFYLREEHDRKGQFIKNIEAGSPAKKAGLKDNDRVVAVNGESVEELQHEDVVEKIRLGGEKASLLVVDKETDEMYMLAGISPFLYKREIHRVVKTGAPSVTAVSFQAQVAAPTLTPQDSGAVKYKPKLCTLVKGSNGYGFHLNAIKNVPGQYIKEVVKGGPADISGLEDEDVLVEVNGVNVEMQFYEDVVKRIQEAGPRLTLLVASKDAYEYLKAQNSHITSAMANPVTKFAEPPSYTKESPAEPEKSTLKSTESPTHTKKPQTEPEKFYPKSNNKVSSPPCPLSEEAAQKEEEDDTHM
ncbi:Na(+)/H(+) exchange regulatory cofactor NHE-RF3 isoform X2 [Microcaecilia unicolor]|nr:Na(+)/H(+) exchange regulatory cofactor NHE-RF3 isoform X2 [Microcaecilia unicolor]XP_030059618.1 Na(+)/H(+) exchange regulatory cofactor NHE-RF3 isoform X2 [Microcaecilia unicolor]XP_030059619.1 Na(+)/H(+) exchange regulatory cofactor NHE-RF3 isoform X2 [Microcaecilia unicolor]XP_030059620.1 Na(+)/H(+) exchange regulatory cofactor NHE-RF3 isoform X2 [Microcaecilia unicolor]XP_030059621.1 Na(+)/H(+) exchange regulatory cofactor NHE-RF3 isoform X2 [Microcaecilia unicolor]